MTTTSATLPDRAKSKKSNMVGGAKNRPRIFDVFALILAFHVKRIGQQDGESQIDWRQGRTLQNSTHPKLLPINISLITPQKV